MAKQRWLFAGTDPGATHGWLVVIDEDERIVFEHQLPNHVIVRKSAKTKKGNAKTSTRPEQKKTKELFRQVKELGNVLMAVEELDFVGGRVRVAAVNFVLGGSYYLVLANCEWAELDYVLVDSDTWQGEYWEKGTKDKPIDTKEMSRRTALKLFPHSALLFQTDNSDGKADAALMALWRKRQFLGELRNVRNAQTTKEKRRNRG